MNKQISKYVVGIEELDDDYKPLEHIDTWNFEEFTEATDKYNTLCCKYGSEAKYLKVILADNSEVVLESWGYFRKCNVYTIEYGFIQDDNEPYCTNEVNFITKEEYEQALKEILESTIGNMSHKGYYIECYLDEELLGDKDLNNLRQFDCIEDSAQKINLIQQFLIDMSGNMINYFKECK